MSIHFNDVLAKIVMVKDLTQVTKYEKVKFENHLYELMAATVSHDMRTPLNSIIGLLQTVKPFVKEQRGQTLLTIIENSAKILLHLVNDILDGF